MCFSFPKICETEFLDEIFPELYSHLKVGSFIWTHCIFFKMYHLNCRQNFLKIHPLALEKYHLAEETFFNFAFKEEPGKYWPLMIDN